MSFQYLLPGHQTVLKYCVFYHIQCCHSFRRWHLTFSSPLGEMKIKPYGEAPFNLALFFPCRWNGCFPCLASAPLQWCPGRHPHLPQGFPKQGALCWLQTKVMYKCIVSGQNKQSTSSHFYLRYFIQFKFIFHCLPEHGRQNSAILLLRVSL